MWVLLEGVVERALTYVMYMCSIAFPMVCCCAEVVVIVQSAALQVVCGSSFCKVAQRLYCPVLPCTAGTIMWFWAIRWQLSLACHLCLVIHELLSPSLASL